MKRLAILVVLAACTDDPAPFEIAPGEFPVEFSCGDCNTAFPSFSTAETLIVEANRDSWLKDPSEGNVGYAIGRAGDDCVDFPDGVIVEGFTYTDPFSVCEDGDSPKSTVARLSFTDLDGRSGTYFLQASSD
jgi:hypothetical protein